MNLRFRLSLQRRILLYLILAAGGSGLAGTAFAYYQSMAPLERTVGRIFQGVASESASSVKETVAHHVEECRLLAVLQPVTEALTEADRRFAELTPAQAAAFQNDAKAPPSRKGPLALERRILGNSLSAHLAGFVTEDEPGKHLLVAVVDRRGVIVGASARPNSFYFGESRWFRQVIEEHQTVVDGAVSPSESAVEDVSGYTFQVTYPIQNRDGLVQGAILMVHPTDMFLERFSQIQIGRTGHSMLLDSTGQVMFCPIMGVRAHGPGPDLIAQTDRDRPGWRVSLHDVHFPEQRAVVAYAPVGLDTKTQIASAGGSDVRWFITTSQDPAETYAYLRGLLARGAATSAAILLMVLVIGLVLSRRLAGPIAQLRKGVAALAGGNLSYRFDIHTGDEIEELAEQFNEMAEGLEKSENRLRSFNTKLEKEVERRTFELSLLSLVPAAMSRHSDPDTMIKEVLEGVRSKLDVDIVRLDVSTKPLTLTHAAASSPMLNYPGWESTCRDTFEVPIHVQQQVAGQLVLGTMGRHRITDREKWLARLISQDLEVAVENIVLARETQRLAVTDSLTGLYNRRELERMLDIELDRASRTREVFSLLLLDVDGLKAINDSRGHLYGDQVLVALAEIFRSELRAYDFACRCGGDEFCVYLPSASPETARAFSQRLRQAFAQAAFDDDEGRFAEAGLSLSIGIAAYPADGPTQHELMDAADTALYSSKFSGGDTESIVDDAARDLKELRRRDPLGWRDTIRPS